MLRVSCWRLDLGCFLQHGEERWFLGYKSYETNEFRIISNYKTSRNIWSPLSHLSLWESPASGMRGMMTGLLLMKLTTWKDTAPTRRLQMVNMSPPLLPNSWRTTPHFLLCSLTKPRRKIGIDILQIQTNQPLTYH